jgi:serine/threonine protein kinase
MKGKLLRHSKYYILRSLGKDVFSETFLAKDNHPFFYRRYVIKRFRPILGDSRMESARQLFNQEVNVLKRLNTENNQIPQLYDCFMDGEDFYLVREWIKGITLEQKLQQKGKLAEVEVREILTNILSVLNYIHGKGMVYGDLKPSSIVLRSSDCLPVPIYFSGVKELQQETKLPESDCILSFSNDRGYIPPEQERGQSVYASDLYSLGLTAIYLLTGKAPHELVFNSNNNKILWHQEAPNLLTNLGKIIDRAICFDLNFRFASVAEMQQALHSRSIVLVPSLVSEPTTKLTLKEVKVISTMFLFAIAVIGTAFFWLDLDFSYVASSNQKSKTISNLPLSSTSSPLASVRKTTGKADFLNNEAESDLVKKPEQRSLNVPIFTTGTAERQVIAALGKPTKRSKGYWSNSNALLYAEFVPNKVDLGYISDTETKKIRQTEMSFADPVPLPTVQNALNDLLSDNSSTAIKQSLKKVYTHQSDFEEFQIGNLEGIIERHSPYRIYIGVWERGFHSL